MTTMIDVTTLTDSELNLALGAAIVDSDDKRLTALEAERERRRREADRATLAAQERQRRAKADAEQERSTLLEKLIAQCDDLRARFVAELDRLDVTPPSAAGPVLQTAYELGRQWYALSHDLAALTGNRQRFASRYGVLDQLELHGGAAGRAFVANLRGHVSTVPTPWTADLEKLRALLPRHEMPSLT